MCDATEVGSQGWDIGVIFTGAEALPVLLYHLYVLPAVQDGNWALAVLEQQEGGRVKDLPMRMDPYKSQRPFPTNKAELHGYVQGRLGNGAFFSREPWKP